MALSGGQLPELHSSSEAWTSRLVALSGGAVTGTVDGGVSNTLD